MKKLKPKKVEITPQEVETIKLGLDEIEGTIGYGELSGEQLVKHEEAEMRLRNLLDKISNE